MSAIVSFVKDMWNSLFKRKKKSGLDVAIQMVLDESLKGAKTKRRAQLAKLITSDLYGDGRTDNESKRTVAREWAMACVEAAGLVVSLHVRPDKRDAAVEQLLTAMKKSIASYSLMTPDTQQELAGPTKQLTTSNINNNPDRKKMIADLEAQALLTQDLGVKAALQNLADIWKKEDELGEQTK